MEKLKQVVAPRLSQETLVQLNQMKTFVDASLKEVCSQSFESEADKIKYLLNTLYNIRDFVLTQTTDNSLRISLIQQFQKIEEEEILGNDLQGQDESTLKNPEGNSEQSPLA